ncbi:hypothetical protein HMPREF1138_1996 [Actinomyces sp. ICM58]|nr:hypothetical protein HMPREF1138_1996 [Actinomyces sp. ICM58]
MLLTTLTILSRARGTLCASRHPATQACSVSCCARGQSKKDHGADAGCPSAGADGQHVYRAQAVDVRRRRTP